jgi:hypothetical protein
MKTIETKMTASMGYAITLTLTLVVVLSIYNMGVSL